MTNPTYMKLSGWLTRDPQLRQTNGDGTSVCTIRLGVANRWLDRAKGEWREGPVSYYDVVCWRSLAMNVAMSLRKGQRVTVHGTFRNRTWTDKDNNPRISLEITAFSVGHDLTYGVAHFARAHHASPQATGRLAEGEASRVLDAPGGGQETGRDGEQAQWPERDAGRTGQPGQDADRARWPESDRPEENPFRGDEAGESGQFPTDEADERAGSGPSAGPAYEPAGERVSGAGDEGGDAGTAEGTADEPRREEVAVPV